MEKHGSDKCWKLLFQSIPLGGKTERVLEVVRAKYEQQRTEETLRKALWISNIWGNAGFDVLGLKEKDGGLIPSVTSARPCQAILALSESFYRQMS